MTKTPTSFADAYKLLDQASSDLPTPALGALVMTEVAHWQLGFNDELKATQKELSRGASEVASIAKDLGALGLGHAEDVIEHVNQNVKANPLLYAGGAALSALALGYLLSRPKGPGREVRERYVRTSADPLSIDQLAEGVLP